MTRGAAIVSPCLRARHSSRMMTHGKQVIAEANVDVYEEIFDWVAARLKKAKKSGA